MKFLQRIDIINLSTIYDTIKSRKIRQGHNTHLLSKIFKYRSQSLQESKKSQKLLLEYPKSILVLIPKNNIISLNQLRSCFTTQQILKLFNRNYRTWSSSVNLFLLSSYFQLLFQQSFIIWTSQKILILFFGGYFWNTTLMGCLKMHWGRIVYILDWENGQFRLLKDFNSFIAKTLAIWT